MKKKHKGNIGRVLEHLKNHDGITSMQAFELFGVTRLSAIIFRLRDDGYVIKNVHRECLNRYGDKVRFVEYQLVGEEIK